MSTEERVAVPIPVDYFRLFSPYIVLVQSYSYSRTSLSRIISFSGRRKGAVKTCLPPENDLAKKAECTAHAGVGVVVATAVRNQKSMCCVGQRYGVLQRVKSR